MMILQKRETLHDAHRKMTGTGKQRIKEEREMRSFTKSGTTAVKRTAREKWRYVIKNWQLYVVFLLPGLLLTIIFKYLPMGGVLIAFEDYNVIKGVFGSP